jgi:DNA end-binding protein Ku
VLAETGKVGIAKVTMRNREHLAAVKADGSLLVMELMHFAHEIASADAIKVPAEKKLGAREKEMAKTLVNQMTSEWEPERYKDEYAAAVMKLVDEKVKAGGKELPGHKKVAPAATNVVDLVKVLQESLAAAGKGGASAKHAKPAKAKKKATHHRHAA